MDDEDDLGTDVSLLLDRVGYFVYTLSFEDEIQYIGLTCSLVRRLREYVNRRLIIFNRVFAKAIPSLTAATAEEKRLIRKHQPPFNVKDLAPGSAELCQLLEIPEIRRDEPFLRRD